MIERVHVVAMVRRRPCSAAAVGACAVYSTCVCLF